MITAFIFNAWGKQIGEQRLSHARAVMLTPFPTWQYVVFRSETSGRVMEMFAR